MEMTPQEACLRLARYIALGVSEGEDAAAVRLRKALSMGELAMGLPDLGVWGPEHAKRKLPWRGLTIDIENPRGSRREGVGPDGPWSTLMLCDYGYIRKTQGADGDDVDVYIGPLLGTAQEVYIIHQRSAEHGFASFDEDKCMLGFPDAESAKRAYEAHYDRPDFFGGMSAVEVQDFVEHVKAHRRTPGSVPDSLRSAQDTASMLAAMLTSNLAP